MGYNMIIIMDKSEDLGRFDQHLSTKEWDTWDGNGDIVVGIHGC
jgi:hypothetical protein